MGNRHFGITNVIKVAALELAFSSVSSVLSFCIAFGSQLFAAFWERPIRFRTIAGLLIAILIYGGTMLAGIVSWESHLVGFIAGGVWALLHFRFLLKNPKRFIGVEAPSDPAGLPTSQPPNTENGQGYVVGVPVDQQAPQKPENSAQNSWWRFGKGNTDSGPSKPPETSQGPSENPFYASPAAMEMNSFSDPSGLETVSVQQGAYKNPFLEG
eukprot:scaffold331955_cov51-Prasinocladus_malaysianus.AAC.1